MFGDQVRAAAASGHTQDLARLLSRPDPQKFSPDSDGRTALHLAASAGHTEVTSALILAGAPINALDSSGYSALQVAASEGHEQITELLLKHGANPNSQDNVHGNTALHEASWKGFSRTVAALCQGKANMHIKNFGGFAALHLCCQNGHNQSCRELLIAGCSPDLQNNYGDTPLHTSARYGHAGVTRILISAHCRVSDQNKNGDTAMHIAAAMGRRKMTRILLEAGCNKSLRNKQQETAKDIATRKDLNEILTILNNTKKHSQKKKDDQDKTDSSNKPPSGPKPTEKKKTKSEQKVHFEKLPSKNWSPYGCHYYPDSKAFPSPNLDSLPSEPLHKGEQYYLDLAGNIRKGPVGVGYTCYCAPFFQQMEARIEKEKDELKKHINSAEKRIDKKVQNLERQTEVRISQLKKQHQHLTQWLRKESYLPRTRSLDLLDDKSLADEDAAQGSSTLFLDAKSKQADHRSMDDLCSERESGHIQSSKKGSAENIGHFWRSQWSSERIQKLRGSNNNKTKCPDLVSSVNLKADKISVSPHIGEFPEVIEPEATDLLKVKQCEEDGGGDRLPSWRRQELRRSVHEIVSRVQALQWRPGVAAGARTPVTGDSDSSDGEDCEHSGPWSEVKRLPFRSRSAVYSPTLDRDNNDSGYSTKICSNSQGPSPSLSGCIQGDDLHIAQFYMEQPSLLSEKHHAVPFHPHPESGGGSSNSHPYPFSAHPHLEPGSGNSESRPYPFSAHPHSERGGGNSETRPYPFSSHLHPEPGGGNSDSRPLPSSFQHYKLSSELTQGRFSAKECQNLHTEASLV